MIFNNLKDIHFNNNSDTITVCLSLIIIYPWILNPQGVNLICLWNWLNFLFYIFILISCRIIIFNLLFTFFSLNPYFAGFWTRCLLLDFPFSFLWFLVYLRARIHLIWICILWLLIPHIIPRNISFLSTISTKTTIFKDKK